MHNLYAIFAKFLDICKQMAGNLVNEQGNIPRAGVVPRFSDLEVIALNMTSEAIGIDSESYFFALLQAYRKKLPTGNTMTGVSSPHLFVTVSGKESLMRLTEVRIIFVLIPNR